MTKKEFWKSAGWSLFAVIMTFMVIEFLKVIVKAFF